MVDEKKIYDIHQKIIQHLSHIPNFRKVHEDEYVINCINCERDSDKKHGHLYINFQPNGVILANCFKCPLSLKVGVDFLHKLGIYDSEIIQFIKETQSNKKILNYNNGYLSQTMRKKDENRYYKIPRMREEDVFKKYYFEKRTGIKLNNSLITEYSLIFNLLDFLEENNIPLSRYDRSTQYLIKELSKNFLGFLSANRSMISFRCVRKTNFSKNKFNFVIDPEYKISFYYTLGVTVDLMTPKPKIVLAEGPFDIICIRERFYTKDTTDTIFAAVGGKANYKKILREIIHKTGFLNAEIFIFSDRDVQLEEYTDNILMPYKNILHGKIIYNELSKDFGDINTPFQFKIYKF